MPTHKPRIALTLGDPAGIGAELVGRLLAEPGVLARAQLLLIAHPDELARGLALAGHAQGTRAVSSLAQVAQATQAAQQRVADNTPLLLPLQAEVSAFARGVSSAAGGAHALQALGLGVQAVQQGLADALVFAPLNKHSLHLAGMQTQDELHWLAQQLGYAGPVSEFNVLDGLWTSRVTSHIALKDVAACITGPGVVSAIQLVHQAVLSAGIAKPRIAVCGLNPHNGDNGSFGREEIDTIAPAVLQAQALGFDAQGPFPADTIFLRLQGNTRQYDAVVTMYHDQGQIAMKLMGFWRGVTVQGGLPIPITTPAHGTAFDIQGQGRANPGAMVQAFALACQMAAHRITHHHA